MGKSIMIGIGVFILGFLVSVLLALVFYSGDTEHSYYYAIIFSTLFLSAIVAISKLFNLPKSDQNDIITEVFKSKMVVMGSPTVSSSILHSVAGFSHFMKELKFKNKKAAAFGCYGWSGESTKVLNELMDNAGFEVIDEGFRNQWNPDNDQLLKAIEYGKNISNK